MNLRQMQMIQNLCTGYFAVVGAIILFSDHDLLWDLLVVAYATIGLGLTLTYAPPEDNAEPGGEYFACTMVVVFWPLCGVLWVVWNVTAWWRGSDGP